LLVTTLNGLLHTSEHVKMAGSCVQFKPSDDMIKRMTKEGIYEDTVHGKTDVDMDDITQDITDPFEEGLNLNQLF
jgi:hypothetical protein